jgi:UDP-glucose 4-epimerase
MLKQAGHCVIGLDVASGSDTQVIGSVEDKALIDHTMAAQAIEAIVHSGALHKPDIVRYPAQAFVDVNVTGTLNLLEAAAAAGHDRFLFTSTTSLMIREDVRAGKDGGVQEAFWLDEDFAPLAPRNIYGVTKLAAEELCRLYSQLYGINVLALRTGRFFPEDDDTHVHPSGPNLKANELLNRRLAVEDAAWAHVVALHRAPGLGFQTFVLSAPPPFDRSEATELLTYAPAVIARHYPDAATLYAAAGWELPAYIDRIYDPSKAERLLGWRARTDFGSVLAALANDEALPFAHDPTYLSPKER